MISVVVTITFGTNMSDFNNPVKSDLDAPFRPKFDDYFLHF